MIFQSFRKAGRITVGASADSNSSRELQKQVIVPEYDIPGNGRIFTPAPMLTHPLPRAAQVTTFGCNLRVTISPDIVDPKRKSTHGYQLFGGQF